MNAQDFLRHLDRKIYCRIGVSKIHGVGVIAIRDIPKGINPMPQSLKVKWLKIPREKFFVFPQEIQKLVIDLCPEDNNGFFECPNHTLNDCGVAWYLNHSDKPNMMEEDGDFISIRDIKHGEELTVNYSAYSKLNL